MIQSRRTFLICSWCVSHGTKYSRMDQVKFFEGWLPQISPCPFLNTLTHVILNVILILSALMKVELRVVYRTKRPRSYSTKKLHLPGKCKQLFLRASNRLQLQVSDIVMIMPMSWLTLGIKGCTPSAWVTHRMVELTLSGKTYNQNKSQTLIKEFNELSMLQFERMTQILVNTE